MQLGCSLPVGDIGTGPAVLRDYAQAAEGLGFAHLVAPDHVLGANPARRITRAAGSARPPPPITTRSCCSGFSLDARSGSALPSAS